MTSVTTRAVLYMSFFIGVSTVTPSPVHAQCFEACLKTDACDQDSEANHLAPQSCVDVANRCEAQCAENRLVFGAIAFDADNTAWGFSDAVGDATLARESALSYCKGEGSNCKVAIEITNSCAALATGNDSVIAFANEPTVDIAETSALASCASKGGTRCVIKATRCYLP